jgi:lipopolysaccharide export system permease protein
MVVWFSAGQSLAAWVRPVLSFGLPIVVLTALLSFTLTPWANRQSAEYRERFAQREDVSRVSPGKFQESSSADRVFFVEGLSTDATNVRNVFVNTNQNGRSSIVVANEGTIEIDARGDKFLVLKNGRRYDGTPPQPDFQLMEFARYGVLISRQSQAVVGDTSARALPTEALLENRTSINMGELLWRMALPLMSLLLMLLAIPLSFVNPRGGRSMNLLIALFLFVVYSNMVSVFQASVVQQKLSMAVAWWPMHLITSLLIGTMFLWRQKMNSRYHPLVIWSAMKRGRRSGAAASGRAVPE